MISVPLRQFLDALALSPTRGSAGPSSGVTAPTGDFSAVLSGASINPPATVADPPNSTLTTSAQPQPQLPVLKGGQEQSSPTPLGEAPAPSRLIPSLADEDADAGAEAAFPTLPAKLLASLRHPGNTVEVTQTCDPSVPATDPKLPTCVGALPKLAKRSASIFEETSKPADPKEQPCELDPALLTIQQALVAAASFSPSSPSSAQPQVGQPQIEQAEKNPRTAVPGVSVNELAAAQRASPYPDEKSSPAEVENPLERQAPSQGLQSHDLASLLDQQLLQPAHRSDAPRSALPAARTMDAPAQLPTSDLHQLDALVRDIAEVSGTGGRAALRLTAEQLGNLEIKLHRSDEGISVTIRTESEQAHSSVAQAQQQLADDMRANGLKLAATSVMLGHGGTGQERHDRQGLPFAPLIEAAAKETDPSETSNDERPDGRYA